MARDPTMGRANAAWRRWQAIAYPALKSAAPPLRDELLARARNMPFDFIERVAMIASVVLVTYLLQSVGRDIPDAFTRYLLQFVIALPMLALLIGPFLLRRTRRGLDLEISRRGGGDPCTRNTALPASLSDAADRER